MFLELVPLRTGAGISFDRRRRNFILSVREAQTQALLFKLVESERECSVPAARTHSLSKMETQQCQ